MNSMVARPTYCPIVAALAAPITPHPATKTKNKSRLRLTAFAAALAISGVLHHTTVHSFIACCSLVNTHHNCCRHDVYSQNHEAQVLLQVVTIRHDLSASMRQAGSRMPCIAVMHEISMIDH